MSIASPTTLELPAPAPVRVQPVVRHQRRKYDMERAKWFWTEQKKKKTKAGNCSGCGKPVGRPNRKTCLRCCQRCVIRRRELIEEQATVMQGEMVEKLQSALTMIFQLRREVNALRASFKAMRVSRAYIYQNARNLGVRFGVRKGVKEVVKFQEKLKAVEIEESLGKITRQELAMVSHAYDRDV